MSRDLHCSCVGFAVWLCCCVDGWPSEPHLLKAPGKVRFRLPMVNCPVLHTRRSAAGSRPPPAHLHTRQKWGSCSCLCPLCPRALWGDPGDVGPSEQPGTSERHRVPSHRARPASRLGRLAEQQALCAPSSWGLRCPCCCQQVFASVSSVILTWVTACRLCLLPD